MTFIPSTRIRLYGIDLATLIVGISMVTFWVYPIVGICLAVVATAVRAVVGVTNARIPH